MAATAKDAFGEIMRLRNEAYQKWIDTPTDDEYNRIVIKAKFQAYDKCMELLQPVVIPHRQTEENRKFDGWDYLLKRNEELVRENTRLKDYLQQVYFLMQNIKENDGISLELMTKMDSWMDTYDITPSQREILRTTFEGIIKELNI